MHRLKLHLFVLLLTLIHSTVLLSQDTIKLVGTSKVEGNLIINQTATSALPIDIQTINKGLGIRNLTNVWELYNTGTQLQLYYNDIYKGLFSEIDGAYIMASDIEFKTNIKPIENVLDRIMLLEPSVYNFKEFPNQSDRKLGFIAQDVNHLFPRLVSKIKGDRFNSYLGINYSSFVVVAIKAIQEQQNIINSQEKIIITIIERLEKIETELSN